MATALDNFFVRLDYVFNEKNAKRFNNAVKRSTKAVKRLSVATIGFGTALGAIGAVTVNATDKFTKLGKSLGTSTENMIALSRASELLSGEKGTAQGILETFEGISNALKAGEEPSVNFLRGMDLVGISLEQFQKLSPEDRLLAVSKGFQQLGEDSQDVATHLLGFDSASRNLVSGLTKANFQEALDGVGDIDEKAMEETNKSVIKLKQNMSDLVTKTTSALVPKINELFENIKKTMPEVKLAITDTFEILEQKIESAKKKWEEFKSIFTLPDFIKEFFNDGKSNEQAYLNQSNSPAAALAGSVANNSQVNNAGGKTLNQNNTINIDVTGSDPTSTGRDVVERMSGSLVEAGRNFMSEDTV